MEKKIKLSDPECVADSVVTQLKPLDKYFVCPITHEIMKDPVIARDGHTYERSAIKKWFKNNNTSPITRVVVSNVLTINYSMRSALSDLGYPLIDHNELTAKKVLKMLKAGKYTQEMIDFTIKDSETNVESLLNLGHMAYYKDHDWTRAKETYIRAIKLGSNNALVALGIICEDEEEDLDRAEKLYKKAFKVDDYATGFEFRAVVHLSSIYKKLSEEMTEKADSLGSETDSDFDSD